jgi:hypothetical protein
VQQLTFNQDSGKLSDVTSSETLRARPDLSLQQFTQMYAAQMILIGLCYSGRDEGLNNSSMDTVHDKGVIRRGKYSGKLAVKPELGPRVFELTPDPSNDMTGSDGKPRFGFFVHWDSPAHNFTASDGCVIPLLAATFERIDDGFELEVVPG